MFVRPSNKVGRQTLRFFKVQQRCAFTLCAAPFSQWFSNRSRQSVLSIGQYSNPAGPVLHRFMSSKTSFTTDRIRNVAIIAHVDHGKTTLVDGLLSQSHSGITGDLSRAMDSNVLEQERGITILSKCTSVHWDHKENKEKFLINIVDTPGHADFGGEVERIMTMVDGVCLIVDATEGPMTQTKFVTKKALQAGLKPVVVINKVDRPTQRVGQVENEIFDLFVDLGANDDQLEYPVLYASGRDGWATEDPDDCAEQGSKTLAPLLDMIVDHVPAPKIVEDGLFRMLVTNISSHTFFGKCLLGRIVSGSVVPGDTLQAIDSKGNFIEEVKVLKLLSTLGLEQSAIDSAIAGQIVSVAGFKKAAVNATICHPSVCEPLPTVDIDPPTVAMSFYPNTSPMLGKEGNGASAAMIKEWLLKEAETNLSISVKVAKDDSSSGSKDESACVVYGRGELQLGILLETMRRQGFELAVCPPQVVFRRGEGDSIIEPCEEVHIEVNAADAGGIIDRLSERKGQLQDMVNVNDKTKLVFKVPTRGLLGYKTEFVNVTSGTGTMNCIFAGYLPYVGEIEKAQDKKGAIIASAAGEVTKYALNNLDSRGIFFVEAGDQVYPGMVVGEHSKENDLEANIAKLKELSNVRNKGSEEKMKITPPVIKTLEAHIAEVRDDEMIEVTPKSIRLRKRFLDANDRKKFRRTNQMVVLEQDE